MHRIPRELSILNIFFNTTDLSLGIEHIRGGTRVMLESMLTGLLISHLHPILPPFIARSKVVHHCRNEEASDKVFGDSPVTQHELDY